MLLTQSFPAFAPPLALRPISKIAFGAFLTCIRYNAICSTAAAAGGSVEGTGRKKKKKKSKGDKGEVAVGAGGDEGGKKKRKKRGGSDSGSGSGGDGDSWYGGEEFDDLIDDRSVSVVSVLFEVFDLRVELVYG